MTQTRKRRAAHAGTIEQAKRALVARLAPMNTVELKRLARGRKIGWQTMYRIGQGTTPDPHVSALIEIERILSEQP